jgi:hypothetical protein
LDDLEIGVVSRSINSTEEESGMPKRQPESPINEKLDEIRGRLLGDPSKTELEAMQLHIDVLEKWARVANTADADHQHNHMDDHDNTKLIDPLVVMSPSKITRSK